MYAFGYSLATQELNQFGGIRLEWLGISEFREAFYNILLWFVPGRMVRGNESLAFAGLLGFAAIALAAYAGLKKRAFRANWLAVQQQPLYLFMGSAVLFNLFMLYEAHISPLYRSPFDSRLLAPTCALCIVLLTSLLGLVWKENRWVLRLGIAALAVWLLFLYVPRSADYIQLMRDRGAGFATPYWHNLDAATFIRSHTSAQLVTTAPIGVYFATGIEIPGISLDPNQLHTYLREKNGYLLVFNSMPLDLYGYPTEQFLKGMQPIAEYSDCTVYQVIP
jgi:hypothetical protein